MNKQAKLAEFYDRNFPRLYRFFYSRTLDHSIAEDLSSETFLRFADAARDQSLEKPDAFLLGIGRNVFTTYLQKKYKQEVPVEDIESVFHEAHETESQPQVDPIELLLPLLKDLPDQQSVILKLRLIEKLSLSEVCKELGKQMSYVKTTQNRAIKTLRKLLELGNNS